MKIITSVLALAVTAALTTACDKPNTESTAYNNSGSSAAPSSTAAPTTTTAPATSDATSTTTAASPTMAPGPAGDATGAVSDTLTTGKIKAALAADSGMKDSDLSVTTNNSVVTLGGTVKSQDQISIATNLAQKQDGVSKVESSITVK